MDLQNYLQKHGLSQEAFGEKLGVSQGLVSQWLNGETGITNERAKQIAAVTDYEVTPHDLLPGIFPAGFRFPEERKRRADAGNGNGGKKVAA